MKLIEEQVLHNNYVNIGKYLNKNKKVKDMFNNIGDLVLSSAQESAIKSDNEFFDEILFILSVISSIISKPLLVTKSEETLLRSEQCPGIQFESLQRTIKDTRLWKQKDASMLPENVYYNQSSDELATYENRFIVRLIDIIDLEVTKYNSFYMSILRSFDGFNDLTLDSKMQEEAFTKIKQIDRRIKFIKATNFYKEIKRKLGVFKAVEPTNILLKNRLYNYCYKFYRNYISYEEVDTLNKEFKTYYFMLILKGLKSLEFKLLKEEENKLSFKNTDFTLMLESIEDGFTFVISNNYLEHDETKHLLLLDANNDFNSLNNKLIKEKDYMTLEAINLFKLVEIKKKDNVLSFVPLTKNVLKEEDLILYYLKSKITTTLISSDLYTKVCPICKSRHIDYMEDCRCRDCESVYTFFKKKSNDYIYFKKLRRG